METRHLSAQRREQLSEDRWESFFTTVFGVLAVGFFVYLPIYYGKQYGESIREGDKWRDSLKRKEQIYSRIQPNVNQTPNYVTTVKP